MLTAVIGLNERYHLDDNGKKQGEYRLYYSSGELCERSFFVNGKLQGECKAYHRGGRLWLHIFMHNGEYHGEYHSYDESGRLLCATYYHNGVDLEVDPATLSDREKFYIMMSGRLPEC